MKITGIVCEYNPFHNGHLHHINETRKNGATHIVAVMSGNFVQRGETAIADKFTRASWALKSGADLVIEIPSVYALSSAEFYAKGSVSIMNSLGCVDEISFGSECGNISLLSQAMKAVTDISMKDISEKMESGMTYPLALSSILNEKCDAQIANIASSPNNILAIEYLKALLLLDSSIKPFTVSRHGAGHDSMSAESEFASASYIRSCMLQKNGFEKYAPDYVSEGYEKKLLDGNISDIKNLERIILYKLRTVSLSELRNIPDVGQGLEHRLKQFSHSQTLEQLLENIKTKRYTMARLKRILLNMVIGITSDDLKILPPYARVLGMNERGREVLSKSKGGKIPVSTSLSKLSETGDSAERFVYLEGIASDIYGLSQNKIGSRNDDFRASIRIEKDGI